MSDIASRLTHALTLSVGDWIGIVILSSIVCLISIFPERLHHDVALCLHQGNLIVEGKLPYVDIVEVNLPLMMYLSALPAYISRVATFDLAQTGLFTVALLAIWSSLTLRSLLALHGNPFGRYQSEVLFVFWAGFSLLVWISGVFGHREHLFVLLFFPYLILRFLRWNGFAFNVFVSVPLGIAASIGACLKPHFVFMAMLPELYWLATIRTGKRILAPEILAFVGTGIAYAFHFILLPEIVRTEFFARWTPLLWKYYKVYDCSTSELIRHPGFIVSIAAVIVSFIIRSSRVSFSWAFVRPASILLLGGLLVYFIQHKGYGYQTVPALAFAVMLFGVTIGQVDPIAFPEGPNPTQAFTFILTENQTRLLLISLTALIVVTTVSGEGRKLSGYFAGSSNDPMFKAIVNHSLPDDSVMVISTSVVAAYPAIVLSKRNPGSRYLVPWLLAFFSEKYATSPEDYKALDQRELQEPEVRFLINLQEDVARFRPKLIIIHKNPCQGCVRNFRILEFLYKIGFVEGAMKDYHLLNESVPGFSVFQRN